MELNTDIKISTDPIFNKISKVVPEIEWKIHAPLIYILLDRVLHLVEKPEQDDLPLPMASSLCNQEIINRCDQLICLAFHDSETLLASARTAEDMGKVVSLLYFD